MSVRNSEPTKTIWVTREGERIPVRKMTDSHLVNTIRYLRRAGATEKAEGERAGYSVLGMLQGEMAIDSVERDLSYLESQTVDEYLSETRPTFEALLTEAERRGIAKEQLNVTDEA